MFSPGWLTERRFVAAAIEAENGPRRLRLVSDMGNPGTREGNLCNKHQECGETINLRFQSPKHNGESDADFIALDVKTMYIST